MSDVVHEFRSDPTPQPYHQRTDATSIWSRIRTTFVQNGLCSGSSLPAVPSKRSTNWVLRAAAILRSRAANGPSVQRQNQNYERDAGCLRRKRKIASTKRDLSHRRTPRGAAVRCSIRNHDELQRRFIGDNTNESSPDRRWPRMFKDLRIPVNLLHRARDHNLIIDH